MDAPNSFLLLSFIFHYFSIYYNHLLSIQTGTWKSLKKVIVRIHTDIIESGTPNDNKTGFEFVCKSGYKTRQSILLSLDNKTNPYN